MSALKAQPILDTLIPAINIIRKIKACDVSQLTKVLKRLPSVFESHGSFSSLTTIIGMGLFQHLRHQPLPSVLLADILEAFPGDIELDIKDSIYESKLVEDDQVDDEEQKGENSATNHKKQTIPISLLRIPRDLQIHLFHFLMLDDLQNVQRACRALCIVARNPLSLCSLKMELDSRGCTHFLSDCYSKVQNLSVDFPVSFEDWSTRQPKVPQVEFNTNWSRSVTDLSLSLPAPNPQSDADANQSFYFQNVERCVVQEWSWSLSLIQSYETLKHLSLDSIKLDDYAVEQLCKFQNLEELHLEWYVEWTGCSDNSSTPITLCNLRHLHFHQYCDHDLIHLILMGSQPSSVTIKIDGSDWLDGSPIADDICGINDINFTIESLVGFAIILKQQFLPIFAEKQHNERRLFLKCRVAIDIDADCVKYYDNEDVIFPMVELLQFAQSSKLSFSYISRTVHDTWHWRLLRSNLVESILDAPFGTFTAITLNVEFRISISRHDRRFRNPCYRRDSEVDPVEFEKYVLRIFEEKDKCLEAWLVLNENTMKRIGMRSIDIKYKCGLTFYGNDESETDTYDLNEMKFISNAKAAWERLAPQILQTRAIYWKSLSERCVVSYDEYNKTYTFKLRTEAV